MAYTPAGAVGAGKAHHVQGTEPAMSNGDFWTKFSQGPVPYSPLVLAQAPLIYMQLDGATATDGSGNSRTPTAVGGTPVTGVAPLITTGKCWTFDGSQDLRWDGIQSYMTSASMTWEAWIKLSVAVPGFGLNGPIWDRRHQDKYNFWFYVDGNQKVVLELWTSAGTLNLVGGTALAVGTRYHVVGTFDSATGAARIYVNGAQDASGTRTGTLKSDATRLGLAGDWRGAYQTNPYYPFKGQIDEAALYGAALTPAQVLEHYNAGVGANAPPVIDAVYQRVEGWTTAVPGTDPTDIDTRIDAAIAAALATYQSILDA